MQAKLVAKTEYWSMGPAEMYVTMTQKIVRIPLIALQVGAIVAY